MKKKVKIFSLRGHTVSEYVMSDGTSLYEVMRIDQHNPVRFSTYVEVMNYLNKETGSMPTWNEVHSIVRQHAALSELYHSAVRGCLIRCSVSHMPKVRRAVRQLRYMLSNPTIRALQTRRKA